MRPVAVQVEELRGFYQEELEMVLDDLAAMRRGGPVLAEGAGLLPARVGDLVRRPDRAVWLTADGALRRRRARQRPETRRLLAQCCDPEETFHRWMQRDDRWAADVAAEARRAGQRVLAVGGRRTLEQNAAQVAGCLGLT